jgi:hypothetical protein
VLAGRYRLEERVRTRSDGSTWRAVDETLERPVLVRVFSAIHPHGPEIIDAARRAALVEDARLQRVLAAGEERGTAYIVLERVPGRSLGELLTVGPLPAETARRVIGEAAQALDRASTRGLHHLRLRPTSLIIGQDGVVTVSGTAIDAAAHGADTLASGPARRADAVGLVTLLYAALTGRWPGSEPAGLAAAPRIVNRPVSPGDLVAGVPNDLDTLCSVTLGPYDDGPRSPGDLAADLAPWAPPGPLSDPRGLLLPGSRPQPRPRRIELPDPHPAAAASLARAEPAPQASAAEASTAARGPEPIRREPARGLRARTRSQVEQARGATVTDELAVDPAPSDLTVMRSPRAPSAPPLVPRSPLAPPTPGMGSPLAATPAPLGAPVDRSPTARARFEPSTDPADAPPLAVPSPSPAPAPASAEPRAARPSVRRAEARRAASPTPRAEPAAAPTEPPAAPTEPAAAPIERPAAPAARRPDAREAVSPPAPAEAAPVPEAATAAPPPLPEPAPAAPPTPEPAPEPARAVAAAPAPAPADAPDVGTAAEPPAEPESTQAESRRREQLGRLVRDRGRHQRPSRTGARHADSGRSEEAPFDEALRPPQKPPETAPRARGRADRRAAAGRRPDPQPAWEEYGSGPITGVQALDILGAAAQPVEPVGPFGPVAPVERPPREQSRLVVLILAGLVLVLGVFAAMRAFNFDPAPLLNGTARNQASTGAGASSSTTSGPSSSTAAGAPLSVAAVTAIDPQGDDSENEDLAKNVVDGDTSTNWHSERYDSPSFGGIKKGVGLVLDLASAHKVTTVTVTAPGEDGTLQLRAATAANFDGSQLLAAGRIAGSGTVVLRPSTSTSTRYLVLWFTRVPRTDEGRRIVVDEVVVR